MIPGIVASAAAAGGGGGGVLWTPAEITTQLWLDADDASTITIATGVTQWDDKSGNARHVAQATAANQPSIGAVQLNGLPTLSFDGTNDRLRRTAGLAGLLQNVGAATMFIVRRHTATPVGTHVAFEIADATPNTARLVLYAAADNKVRAAGKRTDAEGLQQIEVGGSGLYTVNVNTWEMLGVACDYANSDGFVYLNGALFASNTTFASAGNTENTTSHSLNVGCWQTDDLFLQGGIAEIIVTHSVDANERMLIEGYLAWKWGLEASLPSGHPFENAAPTLGGLKRTNLFGGRTSGGASSAFTPPDNSLLVAVVGVCESSGNTDPSGDIAIAGGSLTWTPRLTIGSATPFSRGVRIFTAPVTIGASMTVTGSMGGRPMHSIDCHVFAYENANTASPVGASASSNTVAGGAGPQTLTLSAPPALTSEVLAVMHTNPNSAVSPITPTAPWWIEQYDNGGANIQMQTQTRANNADTTVSWSGVGATFNPANVAAAIEIKQA